MIKFFIYLLITLKLLNANNIYYESAVSQFDALFNNTNKNIVMLGDSITERAHWKELTNRTDIINRGISGDTTEGLLKRVHKLSRNPKQIFIMIGVNDLIIGKNVNYIFNNYKKILETLKNKDTEIFIQSTLFIGEKAPIKYNRRIKLLNKQLEEYAKTNNIKYIDLNKVLAPKEVLLNNYSFDGLHLTGNAYLEWVKIINKYFKNAKP
ncbi:MAG: lipolytic protein [Arcobacter sp.]|nr:MAG: lipolytic protein [Arcobacter sp.]